MLGAIIFILLVMAGLYGYNKLVAKTPCGCKEVTS